MNWPYQQLSVALWHVAIFMAISVGEAFAVQIQPNPNPDRNTITITASTPGENLVPFSNAGIINIQPAASLSNASRFENAGGIFSAGTITNADVLINNRVFTLQEGSRFNNLTSGLYSGLQGSIGINGTFVNEGAVTHSLGHIIVGERGEYIQRQSMGSFVTPTTITPDAPFTNRGRVHIAAGDFIIDPLRVFAASATYDQSSTGTTQIDARLQNIGGTVRNAGEFTVGATGEYRQQSPVPDFLAGSTTNTGTFTNAGTTNIATGVFTNHDTVVNSGTFQVAALAQVTGNGSYVQTAVGAQTIVNGTFANNINLQAGTLSGTGTITEMVTNTGGVLQPGSSVLPGTLTLANYTQGVYGRLDLKIGGLLAGSQYDVLKVTGHGTFGGSLSVSLINGFTPGLGNRFNLLTCSLGCSGLNSGTLFSGGVSLPSLTSGLAWVSGLTDGGNSFAFTVVAAAVSAPEPGTLLLVGSSLIGLVGWRRRQARPAHASQA